MPLGMRGRLRLGLSYEAGSMQQRYSETQGSGIIRSSGVYLGGETPLGPLYLGIAKADDNAARLFLFSAPSDSRARCAPSFAACSRVPIALIFRYYRPGPA
jgi:hypothetical protein